MRQEQFSYLLPDKVKDYFDFCANRRYSYAFCLALNQVLVENNYQPFPVISLSKEKSLANKEKESHIYGCLSINGVYVDALGAQSESTLMLIGDGDSKEKLSYQESLQFLDFAEVKEVYPECLLQARVLLQNLQIL